MKDNKLIFSLVLIIIILAGAFVFYNKFPDKEKTTINVIGESKIDALADEASVYIGIETLKDSAESSKNENSLLINRVLTSLQANDINKENIETSSYNIYPEYDYTQNGQKLKGYKTVNILKIKTKDFAIIGKIVDVGINAGATNIQSINFELSQEKQNQIKVEAISKASEDAKIKAQATAQGLNSKLGKVSSVTVSDYRYFPRPYYRAESGIAVKEALATEILPGNLEVRANVNVVFELE